jgi:c-di-GMP-binding flagellar brake protein YcgR
LVFQADPNRKDSFRAPTVLRGWRKPLHLLVDRPRANNGSHLAVQEGQICAVRFVHDGVACAFESQVIDWDSRAHSPYMRIKWPVHVEQVRFRRYERIPIHEDCEVTFALGGNNGCTMQGAVVDVSLGGCGVLAHGAIDDEQALQLSFTLPDGNRVSGLRVVVRNVRMVGNHYLLGCAFDGDGNVEERDKVVFFISSMLHCQRVLEHNDDRHILILDANGARCRRVNATLEARGYQVVSARSVVDGLFLLRTTAPRVILLAEGLPCYNCVGTLLARDGYDRASVLLYGGARADATPARHAALPVQESLPEGPDMLEKIVLRVEHILESAALNAAS